MKNICGLELKSDNHANIRINLGVHLSISV